MVFQEHLLFPHLSALDNVAFGPRCAGRLPRRGPAYGAGLARPGRAGRVSARPDPATCPAGRPNGSRWPARWSATRRCCCSTSRCRRSMPAPGSTCGPSCAATWASFAGSPCWSPTSRSTPWCSATGSSSSRTAGWSSRARPAEVARRPRTDYVARLVGLNLLRGRSAAGRIVLGSGAVVVPASPRRPACPRAVTCWSPYRPPPWSLHLTRPEGSAAQRLAGGRRRARRARRPGAGRRCAATCRCSPT